MSNTHLNTPTTSNQQPITVLVTGANGQLGMCIKDLEKKYTNLNFIHTDYQHLDICDLQQVQAFFNTNKIDYCVNCAAYTAVDKAEEEQEKAFEVNAIGSRNLAIACKANQVILIHISTDFVFDGNKTEPYTEEDKPNPINVYGASKLQGEVEIQNILKEHFIIRTSWLYSEYGHNFMKTMLKLAETKDEIRVVSDQIGTPTYAGDLAKAVLNIIVAKKTAYGIYHYSNGGTVSWDGFAEAIFELSGKDVKIHPIATEAYPTAAKRPKYSVLDIAKIKQQLEPFIDSWEGRLKVAIKTLNKEAI